jgi:hypothetical protein
VASAQKFTVEPAAAPELAPVKELSAKEEKECLMCSS